MTTPLMSCGPNLERDQPAYPFEHNVGCFDSWSLVHVGSGIGFGELLGEDSFFATLAILAGYELIEPSVTLFSGESRINQQCDVAVGMLGWAASVFRD